MKPNRSPVSWTGEACKSLFAIFLVSLAAVMLGACSPDNERRTDSQAGPDEGLHIVVTIPPLRSLVEPLAPEGSRVEVLIPPGVSVHGHEIPPSRLAALARADLVVYVGLGLEPGVERFIRERRPAQRPSLNLAEAVLGEETHSGDLPTHDCDHDHHHGHAGCDHDHHHHDHDHGPIDPHIWLDPVLMARAVEHTERAVVAAMEASGRALGDEARSRLASRAAALRERFERVDHEYREAVDGLDQRTFIVAHDAYGWLAKRYGLETVPVAGLEAEEPTPGAIARAMRIVNERGIRAVYVEPQISRASIERIARQTGARVEILDPQGDGDWFAMMRSNLEAIKRAGAPDPG